MSDAIKHECGIGVIRLRKPLEYYIEKYGTPLYGMNKLYLLMQKQHNRGQDGAGVVNIKLDMDPGNRYISRYRSVENRALEAVFQKITKKMAKAQKEGGDSFYDPAWLKKNVAFSGELWMGHLRYGTHGKNEIENCHPMLRQSNWKSRNLAVAGNFNMTNVDDLFDVLVDLGQSPKEKADTVTVMEKMGHFLDEENQRIFNQYKKTHSNNEITEIIENELDLQRVLQRACKDFDGGYAMAGLTGYGAGFVARDPSGIRPAYYYADDEVIVVASEKPAIKTAFDIEYSEIQEIEPGSALIFDKDANFEMKPFIKKLKKKSCSFERIYFSRASDPDIYWERKMLGKLLVPEILETVDYDMKNTVFSYIPNTAETAFIGMMKDFDKYLSNKRQKLIADGRTLPIDVEELLSLRPRIEKLVIKDVKLRTFITDDAHRNDLVSNVYDTTYEVINKHQDTLVVIDDSIVRGTTLERSILTTLDKLEPKKVIVVSSAPQIRYPDCYGIDMSKMKEFVVFRAALSLIEEHGMDDLLGKVYEKCLASQDDETPENHVKEVYAPFEYEELSHRVAQIIKPKTMKAELDVIFQTVDNLHKACPNHLGDWYFTGDYPTPGGNKVVNKAFINFMEGVAVRAY